MADPTLVANQARLDQRLDAVVEIAEDLERLDLQAARLRIELYVAVKAAVDAGGSHGLVAEAAGVSRQRVQQIVSER